MDATTEAVTAPSDDILIVHLIAAPPHQETKSSTVDIKVAVCGCGAFAVAIKAFNPQELEPMLKQILLCTTRLDAAVRIEAVQASAGGEGVSTDPTPHQNAYQLVRMISTCARFLVQVRSSAVHI